MNTHYLSLYKQACRLSMRQLLDYFNIKHERGFHYLMECPFPSHVHTSHTPSFKIYEKTNSFYCFGCKKAGQPPHFYQYMRSLPTLEAALDEMKSIFNFKTSSLASQFLETAKKLRGGNKELDNRTVVLSSYKRFKEVLDEFRPYSASYRSTLISISRSYPLLTYLYESNRIDRIAYEGKINTFINTISNLIVQCKQSPAQDAEVKSEF